jgi:hypothetical protein
LRHEEPDAAWPEGPGNHPITTERWIAGMLATEPAARCAAGDLFLTPPTCHRSPGLLDGAGRFRPRPEHRHRAYMQGVLSLGEIDSPWRSRQSLVGRAHARAEAPASASGSVTIRLTCSYWPFESHCQRWARRR